MAYLNDTEKRLLFSALSREKEICKVIDEQKQDGILLTPFVESLERKFYYDRFEKEIRAKAIDEFLHNAEVKICDKILQNQSRLDFASGLSVANRMLDEIAEQMKEGAL